MWSCCRKLVFVLAVVAGAPGYALDEVPAFGPGDFQARRTRVLAAMEAGLAVVFSARAADLEGRAQDSTFYYLTGVETPGSILLLSKDSEKTSEALLLPDYDPKRERWEGSRPTAKADEKENEHLAEALGFEEIASVKTLSRRVERALRSAPVLHGIFPYAALDAPLSEVQVWFRDVRDHYPHVEIRDLHPVVDSLRLVKDEKEIAHLRRAIVLTGAALEEAAALLHTGVTEHELQAAVERRFRAEGAAGPAFPSIVASGPNATVLHYCDNNRRSEKGELVLLDVGARWKHYCADISRTFPIEGKFTPRQREIYALVYEAQQKAFEKVRPGATVEEVDKAARDYLEEKGYAKYFLHNTSHYLGLDAHDAGDYKTPLAPGVVLTVEPGIYIDEEGVGVRIEDCVLVTEDGCEILSDFVPRGPSEVEAFVRHAKRSKTK